MRCPKCKSPHDRLATTCACGQALGPPAPPPRPRPRPRPREAGEADDGAPRPPAPRPPVRRPPVRRAPAGDPAARHTIGFTGDGGALLGLHLINMFKTCLTLGVYHFWAKVAERRYMYAQTAFHGDRFGYHGEGRELFLGWLKVAGIFLTIGGLALFFELAMHVRWAGVAGQLAFMAVSVVLFPMALIGATRYRLNRTSWRGIRFSFRGRVRTFVPIVAKGLLLSLLTLGLYTPFFHAEVRKYMAEHTYFGTSRFGFDGTGGPLLWPWLASMALTPFTFGLIWFWYRARKDRHFWGHTTFQGARFACSATGVGLWKLTVGNMLIGMFSMGLGKPWIEVRKVRYACENLVLVGPLDVDAIHQEAQAASAAGEGLTDFMETGFLDLEVGL